MTARQPPWPPPRVTPGLGAGDTADFTQVFDSRNAGSESLIPSGIVDDGNGGANYSYTFVTAAGTIDPRSITVTAAIGTKTYDGTTASSGVPTITAGTLATGDATTNFTQVFNSRNAGPESLVPSGIVDDGNGGANYSYTFVTAAGTINQLAITVTAATDTKTYDGTTTSAATPIVTPGLGTGDTADFTQVFDSRNAGSRTLTASGIVNDGNGGANYSYSFVTAAGTIGQRPITISAVTDIKTYDGTTDSTDTPTITAGSLATGDTSTSFTQVFDSRNAGPESLVPSGIVVDGNAGANYSYTFVTAAGNIDKRSITVSAVPETKTYDGTTTSLVTPIVTPGLGAGDTADFTQVFNSRNAGSESLIPSGIVDDGDGGANYSYTFVTATGTINQLAITVTAATDTKTYDGTTESTASPIITGSLGTNDMAAFTQVFDSQNAGSQLLTPTGFVIDGNGGKNYKVTFVDSAGVITPRAVTVTANAESKIVGQPDPALTFNLTTGSLVASDAFTGTLSRVAGEAPGQYAILPGTLALSGNYDLSFLGANLTILSPTGTVTKVVASSDPSSDYGEVVTFTATVTAQSGTAQETGTVVFMDGSAVLGSSPVFDSLAAFSTSMLAVGSHYITAIYEGNESSAPSQSPVLTQTVRPAATNTILLVGPSSNRRTRIVEAYVSPVYPGGGLPDGRVVFDLEGRAFRSAPLSNGEATVVIPRANAIRKFLSARFFSYSPSFKPSDSNADYRLSTNAKSFTQFFPKRPHDQT